MLVPAEEKDILKFWEKEKVFDQLRQKNRGKPRWSFLDGPITANNPMGVHHAWGRTLKDLYQRYKALRGFDQRFQNGFDCQGLWVEVEVEKELGFNSKREIEAYGLEKFSKANRARVEKFAKLQTEQSIRLGQWMDWDNSYFTMSERNNEFIWHFLKRCHENGWLKNGVDSVPWCPRCATAISQHELSDGGYAMLKHPSVYVKFPLVDEPNTALLIWTTTPWTLLANVAAAVKSDAAYVKVRRKASDNEIPRLRSASLGMTSENLILARSRLEVLSEEWEVVDEFLGSTLVGRQYVGPFDHIEKSNVEHRVVAWDAVSEIDGSGIVHVAPGCGKEDHELGKRENLPAIAPLDEFGVYLAGFGNYTGKFAGDVAAEVIADLKERKLLFAAAEEEHSYPICWRCKTPLLFRLSGEWFIRADDIRPKMIAAAKTVQWDPPYALDRMLDWLEHMGDWPISRRRYWGLALPFYQCDCGQLTVVGSKQELRTLAVDPTIVDHLPELHRPWIDAVKITCPTCGKEVNRILEVGDCWLDAGITPFSTLPGDPRAKHGSKEREPWEQWFPIAFVCEAMPQIKLWFYALLFMSVTLEDRAPYQRVMAHMNVVDANGDPMHKSAGNAIWFDDAIEKMGADVMRWIYASGQITNNLKFGFEIGNEVRRKFLVFDNIVKFAELFARHEAHDNKRTTDDDAPHILDQWMLARLYDVIERVTRGLDCFEHWKAAEELESAIDDLSTWYLRRSRERLKVSSASRAVLIEALTVMTQLLSPFIPFTAEALYRRLVTITMKGDASATSIHLLDWPTADSTWQNGGLLEQMHEVRRCAELAHAARARSGYKVRQPLRELRVASAKLAGQTELLNVLRDEVNVKTVTVVSTIEESDGFAVERGVECAIALDTRLDAALKDEGVVRELIRQLNSLRKDAGCVPSDSVRIEIGHASSELRTVIEHHRSVILRGAIASELTLVDESKLQSHRGISLGGESVVIYIKKV